MATAEQIKQREREVYDSVAEVFDSVWARYSARFASDLIDLLYPQRGEAALDIAGGTGAAGLKLAERLGTDGTVTLTDLSPRMLEQAARNAAGRGLSNVTTRVADAENLDLPDSSFDLATCSFGVMFFPNLDRALAEAWRVLKPGGRIGFTVWSVPDRTPSISCPMAAVIRRVAPAPIRFMLGTPGIGNLVRRRILVSRNPLGFAPGRFSARGSLEKRLIRAGFHSVRREMRAYPLEFSDFEDFWEALLKGTPAKDLAERLPPSVLAGVKDDVRDALANPATGAILVYNEAALIWAKKPQ